MRAILLFAAITGGLLSFNSFAVSCPVGATVSSGSYKPYYEVKKPDGTSNIYINVGGCEYLADTPAWTPDGWVASSSPFVSTGNPAKEGVSSSFDENGNQPEPDIPEQPPVPDVKPPEPDKPKPPSGSYVSEKLAAISRMTPDMLYTSFRIDYDKSDTLQNNEMLAKAFLQKLSNVTPPSYYAVDHIKSFMDDWQKTYSYLRPSDAGPYYLWNHSRFVSGEHRFTGTIVLAVDNCSNPDYQGNCPDFRKPLDINDPNYASLSDYRNGITRCDRDPHDSSCNSDDGDNSGSGDSGSGGGGTDTGDKPDTCPPGSYHKPGTPEGSCTTDSNPNPGTGGGSGSGSTDNDDNGDIVGAINRFHADNNASHKQLLDELKKKDDYSDTANKVGDLFTNGISDFKSGAESSINSLIDSLENYAPGLKGFGLPDGFYSGGGHCVPLDMSFSFTVPMINYSVPVKLSTDNVCKFYDGYPRELLRMLIYMLTVFVLIALLKQSLK